MNRPRPIPSRRRGIPAFSVLLIMAALTVVGAAMLPMLSIQYTPTTPQRGIGIYFSWPDASARLVEQHVTSRIEGALSTVSGKHGHLLHLVEGLRQHLALLRQGNRHDGGPLRGRHHDRNLYAKLPEGVSYPHFARGVGEPARVRDARLYRQGRPPVRTHRGVRLGARLDAPLPDRRRREGLPVGRHALRMGHPLRPPRRRRPRESPPPTSPRLSAPTSATTSSD